MKNKITITCRHASFLVSKKQETGISFSDRIRLMYHLLICRTCKLFSRQTKTIIGLLKQRKKIRQEYFLNDSRKKIIKEMLEAEAGRNN